jgi:protein-tyrosine phosphatase
MVAIAMTEHGATPEEAIKIIRNARSGALNMKQTNFLLHYKAKVGNGNT